MSDQHPIIAVCHAPCCPRCGSWQWGGYGHDGIMEYECRMARCGHKWVIDPDPTPQEAMAAKRTAPCHEWCECRRTIVGGHWVVRGQDGHFGYCPHCGAELKPGENWRHP